MWTNGRVNLGKGEFEGRRIEDVMKVLGEVVMKRYDSNSNSNVTLKKK